MIGVCEPLEIKLRIMSIYIHYFVPSRFFTTFLEIPTFPLFRYSAFWEYFLFCDIAVNYKISIYTGAYFDELVWMWGYIIHIFPFWKVQRFSKEAYDSPKTTWNLWAGDKLFLSILLHPLRRRQALSPQSKSSNKQMEMDKRCDPAMLTPTWFLFLQIPYYFSK